MTSKMIYLEGLFSEVFSPDHHLKVCHCNVDQLSIGFIAQLVEHCTSIAEVRVRIPFRPEFLPALISQLLKLCAKLRRSVKSSYASPQFQLYDLLYIYLLCL